MRAMIVNKFGHGNVVCPFRGIITAKDSKVCFNLGINLFCFSISLRVICGGESEIVTKDSSKFFGEFSSELRATI